MFLAIEATFVLLHFTAVITDLLEFRNRIEVCRR